MVVEKLNAMTTWSRRSREKRDMHFLNEDGMAACNPRDREAAHRAEMDGIATGNRSAVTCGKCLAVMGKSGDEKAHS